MRNVSPSRGIAEKQHPPANAPEKSRDRLGSTGKGRDGGTQDKGQEQQGEGGGVGAAMCNNKEMMHVLESTLITWTKQIKNVLKKVKLLEDDWT